MFKAKLLLDEIGKKILVSLVFSHLFVNIRTFLKNESLYLKHQQPLIIDSYQLDDVIKILTIATTYLVLSLYQALF